MSADLTCRACGGRGVIATQPYPLPDVHCTKCEGTGRRRPELYEWDALKAERDRYRTALESIRRGWVSDGRPSSIARAALDSDPDLAERTRRVRADE